MNQAAHFFVQQQLARFAADCRAAAQRLQRAQTLRDVKQWADVRPQSSVASLTHTVPELRALRAAAQLRAEQLVDAQLAELQSLATRDANGYERRLGQLRQVEWIFLRGEHPGLLQRIDREVAALGRGLGG